MATAADVLDIGRVKQDKGEMTVATKNLEKSLIDFNLPDDRNLLIGWTQDRFEDGAKSFFLAGLGLIKLHQMEPNTYSVLIEKNFPNLNLRVAENYMAYAKAMINHPSFQAFQNERGGYSKALTACRICNESELLAADESGELLGYQMEQLAKMSVRVMAKALLQARENKAQAVKKAVDKAVDQTATENAELRAQVKDLEAQAGAGETPADAAMKRILGANDKIFEGIRLLNKVEEATLTADKTVRQQLIGVCEHAIAMLEGLSTDAIHAGAVEGADC
jgi:cell division protein FtsB